MKPGEIVLVRFPFSDLESSKKRPALVLSQSNVTARVGVVTIAMVTSKIEGLKFPGDHRLQDWESAGLLHPSLVRMSKIATVENDLIDKSLGRLSARDIESLRAVFKKHFKAWI